VSRTRGSSRRAWRRPRSRRSSWTTLITSSRSTEGRTTSPPGWRRSSGGTRRQARQAGKLIMPTTIERLQTILTDKFSVDADKVRPDATLDTLGLDSLDLIEVLFEVEEEFDIRVP